MQLFKPARITVTHKASRVLADATVVNALQRHLEGDWGEVDRDQRRGNDLAIDSGLPLSLRSAFSNTRGVPFWVITEADRSITTILLPEETCGEPA